MVVSFEENQTLMIVFISKESFPVDASLKKRYNKKVENWFSVVLVQRSGGAASHLS